MPIAPDFVAPADGLAPGEATPMFSLPDCDGGRVHSLSDDLGGRPFVLALLRPGQPLAAGIARGLIALHPRLVELRAVLCAVAVGDVAHARELKVRLALPFAPLADEAGDLVRVFAIGRSERPADPLVAVVDHNRRIVSVRAVGPEGAELAGVLADLESLAAMRPAGALGQHPPVLVLPRTLSAQECAHLIDVWLRPVKLWRTRGFGSEGYDQDSGDFKIRNESYGRTDQFVVRDPAVLEFIDNRLMRRAVPEIAKAFMVAPQYREDYRIACYDSADGGSLHGHRDNPTPETRHRLFTISVHLNAGDYEGGQLRFREFGEQTYDVERGTAIIWSCALLHEVTDVTKGRRFILGTHLFNDLAAMQRSYAAHQAAHRGS